MHLFNNDPKQLQKQYFKHQWEVIEEKRQTDKSYVNTEVEMWAGNLQQRAKEIREGLEGESQEVKDFYDQQSSSSLTRAQQLRLQEENRILNQKVLHKLPEDAPTWLQVYHLEYYGGFHGDWERHLAQHEGREVPYWHHRRLGLSTWDSPTIVLSALIMNGIESDT